MPKPIALVTAAAARDLDEDLPPLEAALASLGAAAEVVTWDDAGVDWSRYRLAPVSYTHLTLPTNREV